MEAKGVDRPRTAQDPGAWGTPVGNFPTVRGFDGRLIPGQDQRLPRMLGQQIYFYSRAYLLTARQDLLAVQPVFSRADDFQVLGGTLIREFWNGGIFWGQKDRIGQGGRHIDFGHTFKSYWMVNLIDQNLGSNLSAPIGDPVGESVPALFDLAFDPSYGHWGYGPRSRTEVTWGSSWWIWAECDQWARELGTPFTVGTRTLTPIRAELKEALWAP